MLYGREGKRKNDGKGRMGGRQKGTPNKTTKSIKETIAKAWQTYHESGQFEADLECLEPQARIVVMERYAQYIAPKMKSVDVDMNQSVSLTIEDRLRELCGDDLDD